MPTGPTREESGGSGTGACLLPPACAQADNCGSRALAAALPSGLTAAPGRLPYNRVPSPKVQMGLNLTGHRWGQAPCVGSGVALVSLTQQAITSARRSQNTSKLSFELILGRESSGESQGRAGRVWGLQCGTRTPSLAPGGSRAGAGHTASSLRTTLLDQRRG